MLTYIIELLIIYRAGGDARVADLVYVKES